MASEQWIWLNLPSDTDPPSKSATPESICSMLDRLVSPLPLKEAHRMLKSTGATVQLIPGDPFQTLSRVANNLASTDLLVFSADVMACEPDWYYVPRMLNQQSIVFVQRAADEAFEKMRIQGN